jgi:hypothetical protein
MGDADPHPGSGIFLNRIPGWKKFVYGILNPG